MKKFFALIIALMMLTCTAFAEEAFNIEDLYEGEWIHFEDDGFEMYLPSDWLVLEIDQETLENSGIYYAVASPDGSCTFQLAWSQMETPTDLTALLADIQTVYPEAAQVSMLNIETICYADVEADILAFAVLDEADQGVFFFNFTPASNEDMVTLATLMMNSITPVEAA